MTSDTTGRLLVATPLLEDPNFHRAVVLVLDHDDEGAIGVVINRASSVAFEPALSSWGLLAAEPRVIFGGGPVEPTAVVAIGRANADAPADGWEPIVDRLRLVDLDEDPQDAAAGLEQVRIFAGYAGWAPGQLEAEIDQGAWFVIDAEPGDVFADDPDALWQRVLARQPDRTRLYARFPLDPSLN